MTELIDIIYVEDDHKNWGSYFEKLLVGQKMTGQLVQSRSRLKESLDNEVRARLYVLDGNFPEEDGGIIGRLGPDTAKMIRDYDPKAKILFFTSDYSFSYLAQGSGVGYIRKSNRKLEPVFKYARKLLSEEIKPA